MSEQEKQHQYCTTKFIELANQLKDEKIDLTLVSGALMTASGVYATYVAAGNNGVLEPGGVDKVVDFFPDPGTADIEERKKLDSDACMFTYPQGHQAHAQEAINMHSIVMKERYG